MQYHLWITFVSFHNPCPWDNTFTEPQHLCLMNFFSLCNSMQRIYRKYIRRPSSLYNSKTPHVSMHFRKDGMSSLGYIKACQRSAVSASNHVQYVVNHLSWNSNYSSVILKHFLFFSGSSLHMAYYRTPWLCILESIELSDRRATPPNVTRKVAQNTRPSAFLTRVRGAGHETAWVRI